MRTASCTYTPRISERGRSSPIQITASSGLSKDEVERMVREAQAHAEDDRKKRELIDARNQLDGLVYQTERTLAEHGGSLDASTKGNIESALADAKKALESQDVAQMRTAADALAGRRTSSPRPCTRRPRTPVGRGRNGRAGVRCRGGAIGRRWQGQGQKTKRTSSRPNSRR